MAVGAELRRARERAGLSAEQVAERTQLLLHEILALENSNFSSLPDGIYLSDIVRAYADEVTTDPEPLLERMRHEQAAARASDPDWGLGELRAFRPEQTDTDTTVREETICSELEAPLATSLVGELEAPLATSLVGVLDHEGTGSSEQEETADYRRVSLPPPKLGSRRERRRLAFSLVALFAAGGWGAYLYETTYRRGHDSSFETGASQLPSASGQEEQQNASPEGTSPSTGGATAEPAPPAQNSVGTAGGPPAAADPTVPRESSPAPVPVNPASAEPLLNPATVAPAADLSGAWRLDTRVESSSLPRYVGLRLGFELILEQTGARVTGSGRKLTENDGEIPEAAQTPISVSGTMDGDRLRLAFTEGGTQRPTQGQFMLFLDEGGTLRGRFSGTAARSSGTVEGHRLQR